VILLLWACPNHAAQSALTRVIVGVMANVVTDHELLLCFMTDGLMSTFHLDPHVDGQSFSRETGRKLGRRCPSVTEVGVSERPKALRTPIPIWNRTIRKRETQRMAAGCLFLGK
jgi:hypothetical protein